jgi:hypothetical protein
LAGELVSINNGGDDDDTDSLEGLGDDYGVNLHDKGQGQHRRLESDN